MHTRGFTLIELILVIFIMVLLTIMTVPILAQFTKTSKVQQAANIVSTVLFRARYEAIRTRQHVGVFFGDTTARLTTKPTAGILPSTGRVEIWTVKTAGDSDGHDANESPLGSLGAWYPYRDPDRCLTPDAVTLPDGIRVLSGRFFRTMNSPAQMVFGWDAGANYKASPDGEIKRHQVVFARTGAMPGWFDGLNSYYSLLVFDEATGEHQVIWVGEWLMSAKPRILPYQLTGVYGPSSNYYPVKQNPDIAKFIDQ